MNSQQGWHDAAHLRQLADRCEAGAQSLLYEAENAAAVLDERAGGSATIEPQEWAAQKRSAAAAAQAYAQGLRAEADELGDGTPSPERIAQAERVASASELGGILIDPVRLNADQLSSPWNNEEMRDSIRKADAETRAAIDGAGVFEHVDETINGVHQVPFWRLSAGTEDVALRIAGTGSGKTTSAVQSEVAGANHTTYAAAVDDYADADEL